MQAVNNRGCNSEVFHGISPHPAAVQMQVPPDVIHRMTHCMDPNMRGQSPKTFGIQSLFPTCDGTCWNDVQPNLFEPTWTSVGKLAGKPSMQTQRTGKHMETHTNHSQYVHLRAMPQGVESIRTGRCFHVCFFVGFRD